MKKIDLVILAGGRGKRLGAITSKTPKPLIKVNGIPFIQHLINCGFVGQDDKEIIQQWINNLLYQFREEGDISE